MELEFRRRNYAVEEKAYSLPRVPAYSHLLFSPSQSHPQVGSGRNANGEDDIFDPLRRINENMESAFAHSQDKEVNLADEASDGVAVQSPSKEWTSFNKLLMQRFPVAKSITVSSISQAIMKTGKVTEKSPVDSHLEEKVTNLLLKGSMSHVYMISDMRFPIPGITMTELHL